MWNGTGTCCGNLRLLSRKRGALLVLSLFGIKSKILGPNPYALHLPRRGRQPNAQMNACLAANQSFQQSPSWISPTQSIQRALPAEIDKTAIFNTGIFGLPPPP